MYYRIITTLALSFVFYIGSSQISYHRLYETTLNDFAGMNDTIFFHMSSTTISGDVYAMGTKRVGNDDLTIVFTKHSDKGNIDWSKELDLGQDTVNLQGIGNFEFNGALDSMLFVIDAEINGVRKEIFGKLDLAGNELELRTVGGNQFATLTNIPNIAPFINQSDLLLTPGDRPTISRIGLGDDLIWSRSYVFLNTVGDSIQNFVTDMISTPDSTIVLTGTTQGEDRFMVAELDSNGVQIWADSYTFSTNNLSRILPTAVLSLSNGNFAVVGDYLTNGTMSNGFVAVVDTAGSILLAKKLYVVENLTSIRNLVEGADGTLWMSGVYVDSGDSIKYFTSNMDLAGTINWTTIYGDQVGIPDYFTTSLLNVQMTGGATLVGHGFLDDLQVLQVMKHDIGGTTPCSGIITTIIEDLTTISDSLTSEVVNGGIFFDSIGFELNTFIGFSPPILTVNEYPPFCPNEVIDTLLIASVSGVADENISYEWGEGQLTDTIGIMDIGEYTVTVTITEDVCYSMCDTVELTRLMVPQIDISLDNSRFCLEKVIVLTGNYTPGASGQTYLWNTLETTPSIEVTEAGLYSVTVTDACGEMASDNIDVSLPLIDPNVFFGANVLNFCETGSALVTAAYSGGGNQPVFTWSDGQTGNPIIASTAGSYTVSVTDECGEMATFTDDIVFPEIATEAEIIIDPNCDENNLSASTVIFSANGNGEIRLLTFLLEDGIQDLLSESNPTISLPLGNYLLFATNTCGETLDSLSIDAAAICGPLQYPIAFFPGGEDQDSKTFGPIPLDTVDLDRISDVDFKIFNRWGETVFESNAILEAWDGTHKGEPAPSEVYIWYVSYIIDGRQMLDKGDVTLLR